MDEGGLQMSTNTLELQHIEKNYGEKKALNDFSLQLENGLYGLLGENGAGKSTLIKILTCNLQQDKGDILFDGTNVHEMGQDYRSLIGYLPQESVGYPGMRVGEFMEYMASLKGLHYDRKKLNEVIITSLEQVHLEKELHTRFGQLSGGMKRRLLFAQAVLGEPKLLILDEPTAGLDPNERISLRNLIAREAMDKIVILATHIISDIDCVADHIILMKQGQNKGCKSPEIWMDSIKNKVWESTCDMGQVEEIQQKYEVTAMRQCREGITIRILSEENPEGKGWRHCEPLLDEVYLYYSTS
jgi:ABC-type multidrug transport system ATPase subunit